MQKSCVLMGGGAQVWGCRKFFWYPWGGRLGYEDAESCVLMGGGGGRRERERERGERESGMGMQKVVCWYPWGRYGNAGGHVLYPWEHRYGVV